MQTENDHKQQLIRDLASAEQIEALIQMRLNEDEAKSLLLALKPDAVTPELLAQLLDAMQQTALSLPALDFDVMDCCGTGGSGQPHFNTSTAAAFVLAAGGVKVVKFGNRAASSASGSFDFLDALGFPAECDLTRLPKTLSQTGLVFLYAPQCYPALAPLAKLRREVGVRTVFNFLGPLLNPLNPAYRLLGVSDKHMQTLMADYLAQHLPPKRAWLVHSPVEDSAAGLDEIALAGETRVLDVEDGNIRETLLSQGKLADVGSVPRSASTSSGSLANGSSTAGASPTPPPYYPQYTPEENVRIFNAIVAGEDKASECYRMLCLNAGAGLHIAEKADSLEAGISLAEELLASGRVRETLQRCRKIFGGQAS